MAFVMSLTLSHFRSHKHVRLELDKRPVAIFGPNGSGKTNLIEAVSLFSPGRGMRRASAEAMMRRPESLGWKITCQIQTADRSLDIESISESGASRQVKIDGKPTTQVALGKYARILWLVPSMDRLWIEGAEGRRRFLDRIALSFSPEHAEHSLTYDKAMRERNRLLKEQVRDAHWYAALESQMAKSGSAIDRARIQAVARILQAQADTSTQFPIADLKLQQSEGTLPKTEADLLTAFSESRSRDLAVGRTMVGPHKTDLYSVYAAKGVPASDCSTGEQKALLVSIILANARALTQKQGAKPLILLDEVSAHLDMDRRAALYKEVCDLKLQAWMTGTGPELFAELGDSAQFLSVSDQDGASVISQP
jgi:DNA replication and repair protein RecF